MAGIKRSLKPILLFLSFSLVVFLGNSLPLSTRGRFIVDDKTGKRVKLACVNWPAHVDPMLAEGLHEQPLPKIVSTLVKLKFNCVRLTYATFMWTRYSNITVKESFAKHNLTKEIAGIAQYNPSFLTKTLVQAFASVVEELGAQGVMAVLDNHVSKPIWCCSETDGNGFFGDVHFNPQEWILGLTRVASHFRGNPEVVGVSTRNELRGPLSNTKDWYKYINRGASAIHKANPNVLVVASGTGYAGDLTFLKNKTLGTNYGNKLVYDAHWYSFSSGGQDSWETEFLNDVCSSKTQNFINQTGFTPLLKQNAIPLFIGEFGADQRLLRRADDHFMSCFLAYASHYDLDWGLWAWQGNYYFRDKLIGVEETFGVLSYHWNRIRSAQFQKRLELIKQKIIDPSSETPMSYILFHPQSGGCVHADSKNEIYLGSCSKIHHFTYAGSGNPLMLTGTDQCLQAVKDGQAPIITRNCTGPLSSWKRLSSTKLHLAVTDENGDDLCLQKESANTENIITSKCTLTLADPECLSNPQKDPSTQWFNLVRTNVI